MESPAQPGSSASAAAATGVSTAAARNPYYRVRVTFVRSLDRVGTRASLADVLSYSRVDQPATTASRRPCAPIVPRTSRTSSTTSTTSTSTYEATAKRVPGLIADLRFVTVEGGPHNIAWTHPTRSTGHCSSSSAV